MPFERIPSVSQVSPASTETDDGSAFAMHDPDGLTIENAADTKGSHAVEEMLSRAESLSDRLEEAVFHRYGRKFWGKLSDVMAKWSEPLIHRGEKAVDWIEKQGVQLPKSKLGMRILSTGVGTAGSFIPGGAVLWGLSIVLWNRDPKSDPSPEPELNPLSNEYAN